MVARTVSAAILGIQAVLIKVEVDITNGLPAFDIVGLPDKAVRESRERVRSAIKNSGFEFPVKRITINMAPADIKKIGPHFDLAIAAGILAVEGVIKKSELQDFILAGELSLGGEVRKVKGILPMALNAVRKEKEGLVIPAPNYQEGNLVEDLKVIPVTSLGELVSFFNQGQIPPVPELEDQKQQTDYEEDFAEIKGQKEARRALEVAAAGAHNMIMIGPPGSGKTMMARRLRTILPPLSEKEALELTKIYSIMGLTETREGLLKKRPFRAPHHTITRAGLIGGGRIPEPGEVSLAHRGTLFLDEMPEFKRDVLEMLRQPLEEGKVSLVRSEMKATFPADFMLVAAMNPCPCGYYGDNRHECHCSVPRINRYRGRISGPLMDRIDIHVHVPGLQASEITSRAEGESSAEIRKRVTEAHQIQLERYHREDFDYNSNLGSQKMEQYCQLEPEGQRLLKQAIEDLALSARAYDRILRLARTIADLEGAANNKIKSDFVAEAIQYRSLDRRMQI
ncbi:MAG: YifB family Mg chelatase-like AAA ATPase [Bacillota bacterium]